MGFALPAAAAPPREPRADGNIFPPCDAAAATGAGGGRMEEGALFLVFVGEPQDAHVEKAPETQPPEPRGDHQDRVNGHAPPRRAEIGRASCRERVDLGGRRIIKKKKRTI